MQKKIGPGTEPTSANLQTSAYTTGPPPKTVIIWLRDHVQTERQFFFRKLRDILGFHMTPTTATKRKVCLGPGTEIQGTGSLFWQKIGPPICSLICSPIGWDFFTDLGAWLPLPPKLFVSRFRLECAAQQHLAALQVLAHHSLLGSLALTLLRLKSKRCTVKYLHA